MNALPVYFARMITLREYIDAHGVTPCAEAWDESERAVQSWRSGARVPRPKAAMKIIRRTAGALTWDGIYAALREEAAA